MRDLFAVAVFAACICASVPATTQAGGTQPTFVTEQPSDQWSARVFLGETVTNDTGDNIGTVSDLLFDQGGDIKTAVLNVGGLLGVGGKSVAVPFGALSVSFGATGERVIKVSITKDDTIRLGDVRLTAYHTPGHTRGATTWVAHLVVDGNPYLVALPDGAGFYLGYRLVNNPCRRAQSRSRLRRPTTTPWSQKSRVLMLAAEDGGDQPAFRQRHHC
jgi:hypothetical protein